MQPNPRPGDWIASWRGHGLWWRIVLTCLGVLLAWRIGALGMAQFYTDRLEQGGVEAARQALRWHSRQPEALYTLGYSLVERDADAARQVLAEAYRLNPTRARPLLVLGALAEAEGDKERAEQLIETAAALAPVNAGVQERAALFWANRGRLDQALQHWSRAIAAGSPRTRQLFDGLRELLTTPQGREAFQDLVRRPPGWWEAFFVETAEGKAEIALVKALYEMRRVPGAAPLSPQERISYIARLLRERDFEAAYLAWINSLVPAQRQQLGLLYNGGFDLPFTGFGFDWHVVKHDRASISRAPVDGARGQSLRIVFRFARTRFDHLYQPLYLSPGAYRVSGRYRSDRLYSESGLRWLLNCRAPEAQALGESMRIFGSEEWNEFRFEAEVPETCRYQELRLASGDARRVDEAIDGALWFDDLRIVRIAELSPLDRARSEMRRAADDEAAASAQ